jgi:Peptidase M15
VSSEERTQAQAGDESENDAGEETGVEQIEAKDSLSPEERQQADAQVRGELEDLASRGEGEPVEDLFEQDEEGVTRAAPGALRLSPHFLLSEFHCKDAQRTPVPAAAVPALRRLVREVLEPMRAKFGRCDVHSGFRTDAKNAEVGGAEKSQHLYHRTPKDVAADVTFARGSPREWGDEGERLLPQGGVGRYASFVHVDNRTSRARWKGEGVS